MTKITWGKDSDGNYVREVVACEYALTLTVWRREPGCWTFEANGYPADRNFRSVHEAKQAANDWAAAHADEARVPVVVVDWFLGERNVPFLANTSSRTSELWAAKVAARLARAAKAQLERGTTLADRENAQAAQAPAAEQVLPITVAGAHGPVDVSLEEDRLVMVGPKGRHSVLLDCSCRTGDDRDRALIHLAGFLHSNGVPASKVADVLAVVDALGGRRSGAQAAAVADGTAAALNELQLHPLDGAQLEQRAAFGADPTAFVRGVRIARLVAWHVGIAGAPVLA